MRPLFLTTTQTMAAQGFRPDVLHKVEADAIRCAHISLSSRGHSPRTLGEAIDEAQRIVPSPAGPDAMQLFFSTDHETERGPLHQLWTRVALVYRRADVFQKIAPAAITSGSTIDWFEIGERLVGELAQCLRLASKLADSETGCNEHNSQVLETILKRPADPAMAEMFDRARHAI